ncbi:hypothetical protein PYW08_016440 [Mythimna loreyi]|uniref:Uncharacterized protein n=1 Tax=Mythimna loreyi TaxID=667449 RepID=A0ACC2QZQ2_9NEOP|nr:hypothetical protein PYW08_016440 [Mythimna loreyi]
MEGLFKIDAIVGVMFVFCTCSSSSADSSLATTAAKITLTTSKARSTGVPKPNSWYNYRRINVGPVANVSSTPVTLFDCVKPYDLRRSHKNVHFEWDYRCQTQPKPGACRSSSSVQRYYYDAQTDSCKSFAFTGCQNDGNANNFQTELQCIRHCKGSNEMTLRETKKLTYCKLQPNVGICLGLVERYYYDVEAKDCKSFMYGGCGGNQNRFDSYDLCIKRCKHEAGI